MNHLYAPWRSAYVTKNGPNNGCPFCIDTTAQHDAEHFIIKRFKQCALLLNLYPYNVGHLLLIPYAHTASPHELDRDTRHEMADVLAATLPLLQKTLTSGGANVGINLGGKAAGGSVPEHLHIHILPRWEGDTNFLPALADTKPLSVDLNEIYKKLVNAFNEITL